MLQDHGEIAELRQTMLQMANSSSKLISLVLGVCTFAAVGVGVAAINHSPHLSPELTITEVDKAIKPNLQGDIEANCFSAWCS